MKLCSICAALWHCSLALPRKLLSKTTKVGQRWGISLGLVLSLLSQPTLADDLFGRLDPASAQDQSIGQILPGFVLHVGSAQRVVTLSKADGSGQVLMQILKPVPYVNTLNHYAAYVMDFYQGSHLTAQPQRRGYSFRYKDQHSCAGLVTFFDGTSYLLMSVCGSVSQDELTKALSVAKKQLGIDDILYRSALPNVYY